MSKSTANFYTRTRAARKIIVVDLGFLGDSVHLVPALWELKRHYPSAALDVVSAPVGCEVLRLAPCVDRAWALEMDPARRTLRQQWQIVRALRREQYDLAFNFSGADRTIFLTALTGARWRVAHSAARQHFWNAWLIPHWVPRQDRALPVFEQRRQILARCGLDLEPARFDLRIPAAAQDWAEAAVPAGAMHLSINASTHLKEWPLAHWIELARRLAAQRPDLPMIATGSGSSREQGRLEALRAATLGARPQIHSGISVAQLAAVLARCRLHLGADSGVLHLALALGVPTVSLFRQYPGLSEWLPRGPGHRHLTVPCRCADQKHVPCSGLAVAACLADLGPDKVLEAVQEQLAVGASTRPG